MIVNAQIKNFSRVSRKWVHSKRIRFFGRNGVRIYETGLGFATSRSLCELTAGMTRPSEIR